MLRDVIIIIVEDHEETRLMVSLFLLQHGAKVLATANAFEGLQAIKEHRPDIVLTDISLPDRDGFELLQEIRRFEEQDGNRVPVIAMTALSTVSDRGRYLAAGFQAHLAKPYVLDGLLKAINSVLKG